MDGARFERDGALARRLDDVAGAAMPATSEVDLDGWRCRSSPDLPFRRCNSVVPAIDAGADRARFDRSFGAVRRWSGDRGQRLLVVVPSWLEAPDVVDGWLAEDGLEVEAPVLVLARSIEGAPSSPPGPGAAERPVTVEPVRTDRRDGGGRAWAYRRLLAGSGEGAREVRCDRAGAPVGRGFGVVRDGWLGIFGMEVDPAARRQGIGRSLVEALVSDAAVEGVTGAYLQVEHDNEAARALYRSLGFAVHHRYHYRAERA